MHHGTKAASGDLARCQLAAALFHEGFVQALRLAATHGLVKVGFGLLEGGEKRELTDDHQLKAVVCHRRSPLLLRVLQIRPKTKLCDLRRQVVHLLLPIALLDPKQ